MITAALALLRPFLGAVLVSMLRAFILNVRVERGTDPALLEEIRKAVNEANLRTDLDWKGKLELASDRVMAWATELGQDVSRAMVNTLADLRLNEIWDDTLTRAGKR